MVFPFFGRLPSANMRGLQGFDLLDLAAPMRFNRASTSGL